MLLHLLSLLVVSDFAVTVLLSCTQLALLFSTAACATAGAVSVLWLRHLCS
jgi:hypothetical protein